MHGLILTLGLDSTSVGGRDPAGKLGPANFVLMCREELGIAATEISDAECKVIFCMIDADGNGFIEMPVGVRVRLVAATSHSTKEGGRSQTFPHPDWLGWSLLGRVRVGGYKCLAIAGEQFVVMN